jgi:hypothetical protein
MDTCSSKRHPGARASLTGGMVADAATSPWNAGFLIHHETNRLPG